MTLLTDTHPDIAAQWSLTGNPENLMHVSTFSNKKVRWTCSNATHPEWITSVVNRTANGTGCPSCSGRTAVVGMTDLSTTHPEISVLWDHAKNTRSLTEVKAGSKLLAWWICTTCGLSHETTVNKKVSRGYGCPYCSGRRVTPTRSLASRDTLVASEWDYSRNSDTPNDLVWKSTLKRWFICQENHSWQAVIKSRTVQGSGCPVCCTYTNPKIERIIEEVVQGHRHHPTGLFWPSGREIVVDVFKQPNTVIEHDGSYWHRNRQEMDTIKTQTLLDAGFVVIRLRQDPLPFMPIDHPNLLQLSFTRSSKEHLQRENLAAAVLWLNNHAHSDRIET